MKTKPVLIIILFLLIGFVLGMLTSAQLRYHRLKPMRIYFSDKHFREGFYNVIQPDDKQKEEIDAILDKYARINGTTQRKFRREMDSILKSMQKELDSKLTKDQLTRVKEMEEKRQKMIRIERKKHRKDTVDFRFQRRHFPGNPPEMQSHDGPDDHQTPSPPGNS